MNLRPVSIVSYFLLFAGQFEAMVKILSGESAMVVSATGSGKSLIYQVIFVEIVPVVETLWFTAIKQTNTELV